MQVLGSTVTWVRSFVGFVEHDSGLAHGAFFLYVEPLLKTCAVEHVAARQDAAIFRHFSEADRAGVVETDKKKVQVIIDRVTSTTRDYENKVGIIFSVL
jgi:hypothetical protein